MRHYHAEPCTSCGGRLVYFDSVYQREPEATGGADSVVALYRCEECDVGTGMRHLFAETQQGGMMPVLELAVTPIAERSAADIARHFVARPENGLIPTPDGSFRRPHPPAG